MIIQFCKQQSSNNLRNVGKPPFIRLVWLPPGPFTLTYVIYYMKKTQR